MNRQAILDKLLNCYPRWSPTMYKLTLGATVVLAIMVPLGMVAIPFIEFFNGMAAQPKGKAQMTYGRTYGEDRPVERRPVEGTIPRGYVPYRFDHLGNTIEDARKAGNQLTNPLPLTIENLRGGQELYNVYCIVCHGERGEGDGPVIGPDRFPAPPSLHTKQAVGYNDGTLFHIMTKGIGKMPSYADQLDQRERWMVVHYLHALQRSMAPKPEDLQQ
jgi:mono/diheme cytochrome c family protein